MPLNDFITHSNHICVRTVTGLTYNNDVKGSFQALINAYLLAREKDFFSVHFSEHLQKFTFICIWNKKKVRWGKSHVGETEISRLIYSWTRIPQFKSLNLDGYLFKIVLNWSCHLFFPEKLLILTHISLSFP